MELFGEVVRESVWVCLLAAACMGVGFHALAQELIRLHARSGARHPAPARRLEQFEQLARQANGQGIGALPEPVAARGDPMVRSFIEVARRSMTPAQIRSCLDGEIEHRLALRSRLRRLASIAAAATLGFAMCGLGAALVFALQQFATPGTFGPFAWAAAAGVAAGLVGIPVSHRLRDFSRRAESPELLDLTLVATGIEAIAKGDEPPVVRARLSELLPRAQDSAARRAA